MGNDSAPSVCIHWVKLPHVGQLRVRANKIRSKNNVIGRIRRNNKHLESFIDSGYSAMDTGQDPYLVYKSWGQKGNIE